LVIFGSFGALAALLGEAGFSHFDYIVEYVFFISCRLFPRFSRLQVVESFFSPFLSPLRLLPYVGLFDCDQFSLGPLVRIARPFPTMFRSILW